METALLHELLLSQSQSAPDALAVRLGESCVTYGEAWNSVDRLADGLHALGLERADRVAIYLPKQIESVLTIFATVAAGCISVPVNPVLKKRQVEHILKDSDARVLITSNARLNSLSSSLVGCPALEYVIVVEEILSDDNKEQFVAITTLCWSELLNAPKRPALPAIDSDVATILYTSGSTGNPKGVILTHRNIVVGARSVASYIGNTSNDRILSVLPLSFDAGFSQITTAFSAGASVILLEYLLPRDVVRSCAKYGITGITGVPPLWMQLADLEWPDDATRQLRYFANTGGKMPGRTLQQLRRLFPLAEPYLMYGLTEAFRSTYLPPTEVDRRPDSIGKAIPNVEVLVVREDGSPCAPHEPGELVHRGPLVSLGYWKDPKRTAERFRPAPGLPSGLPTPEIAVWSGDTVTMDEEGFLYFVGRRDDMIKTSGYRVSPTEVEEVAFQSGLIDEAIVVGVPHPRLGQGILLIAGCRKAGPGASANKAGLLAYLRENLPSFMVPTDIIWSESALPRNANGKIDKTALTREYQDLHAHIDQH